MQDLLLRNGRKSVRHARAALFGALLGLLLTGCAGDVPLPFLNITLPPPSSDPAPEYPNLSSPRVVEPNQAPVMTDSERQAVEDQLKKLVADRESSVKKKIDKSN